MAKENKNVSIILFPFSVGGPNDAAKDGPSAMLKNDFHGDLEELGYKVKIIKPPKLKLKFKNEKNRIKNIDAVLELNKWLARTVTSEIQKGSFPLTIGGDHSLAIGTITGVSDAINNVGVLWIDRHFDAHHPKNTPSWRSHGMPVAVISANKSFDSHVDFQRLLNIGKSKRLPRVQPSNIVQLAIGEKSLVKPKTKWFLMEDIDRYGINKIITDAISYLLKRVRYVYVAWDIDSMNVTGTGTSGDSQLQLREGLVIAREINKRLRLTGRLAGLEIVEIAPKLERKELRGQTVDWAIQLITTCFGGNLFNNLSRLKKNIHL
ncbi:MAG: arginase family protein [Candidatus Melainabacteria bacterium]|nr:arginase family protein [Candidatus Melainabacteria bacterium]